MMGGESVQVVAMRHDGVRYRWWEVQIESQTSLACTTIVRPGTVMHQPENSWATPMVGRGFYWADRFYNLTEIYAPSGEPSQLYLNIASPAVFAVGEICYRDYELDVFARPGEKPEVRDADEFIQATLHYEYDDALILRCVQALRDALPTVRTWHWHGMPDWEDRR